MTKNVTFSGSPLPLYQEADNNRNEPKKEKGLVGESNH